eukprot:3192112-Ditylum_brightwellii.AAC.1
MQYHMVMGYAIDPESITNTEESSIYGIGQGAMGSPPNWTLVPNIYQKSYEKHDKGCKIQDPTGNIFLNANGKIFVDDKSLLHNYGKIDLNA